MSIAGNIALVAALKWSLDLVFAYFIEPIFGGEPYLREYDGFCFSKWLIASFLAPVLWLFAHLLRSRSNRASWFYLQVQFFIVVVPYLTLFGMQGRPVFHIFIICCAFCVLVTITSLTPCMTISLPPRFLAWVLAIAGICVSGYVFIGLIASGGFGRLNFNFYSVYETRSSYSLAALPGFGYFLSWTAYVINIVLLVFFVIRQRWIWFLVVLGVQLLLFGMTNFKAFLFAPIVVLALCVGRRHFSSERLLLVGSLAVIFVGVCVYLAGDIMGISIVRRALIVPAALHGLYFDYFNDAPVGQLAGTRLSGIFGGAYDTTTVNLIAQSFWGREMSPNVGWLGDAFAQFRWGGIVVYTVCLAILLKLIDSLTASMGRYQAVIEATLVGTAMMLCSSSLTAVLLTHGLLVLLLALWSLSYFLNAGRDS